MNLVADEGVDRAVVERLRGDGHDVVYVAELLRLSGLSNAAKAEVVAEVFRERAAEVLGAFSVISPGQVRIRRES